jgi:hypothetical protein
MVIDMDSGCVGTSVRQKVGHSLQQRSVNGLSVKIDNAYYATQISVCSVREGSLNFVKLEES